MADRDGPKILSLDIECSPLLGFVWQPWKTDVRPNQIKKDWYLLSWAAKWRGDAKSKIMYKDQRHQKDVENDKEILEALHELLDEADIVMGHNVKGFDVKKINARFMIHKMKPPSSFRYIDTLQIAKRKFGFTYNSLDYLAEMLLGKGKKHSKRFIGMDLWKECINGNIKAWEEMRIYNCHDVFIMEQLADLLLPWDKSINLNAYYDGESTKCSCGNENIARNGYSYTDTAKFQRYRCQKCGKEYRSRRNLLERSKKASLKIATTR